jgi:hypothetical protein
MSGAAIAGLLVLVMVDDPLVRVEGSSSCPRPDQVAAQIARFLPARPPDVAADAARVDPAAGGVRVQLRRAGDATIVGEKVLTRQASCAELAEAIGVVLAMWEWPLHPGLVPPIDPAALSMAARPPAATVATGAGVTPSAPERSNRLRFEMSAGARAVLPGPVPGAAVDVVLRARPRGWGGRFVVGGNWWNQTDLAGGQVSWTRVHGGLGLIKGWEGERWFLDAHADAIGAAVFAAGSGYDETRAPIAFDPGAGLGLRGGIATTRIVRMWLEVTVAWWPLGPSLQVEGVGPRIKVATFEPALTLGGSFLLGR